MDEAPSLGSESSDEWTIDIARITTAGELLWLMFTQLSPQVVATIKAGNEILAGNYNIETASAFFLFSVAVAGDFFWPSPARARNRLGIASAFPNRARDMRHLLGLPDKEPSGLDAIRNDVTHVDERLEELYLLGPNEPLVAWTDGSTNVAGTRRYMNFDPASGILHSLGREVNVRDTVGWLTSLQGRISKVSFPLLINSHSIGTP